MSKSSLAKLTVHSRGHEHLLSKTTELEYQLLWERGCTKNLSSNLPVLTPRKATRGQELELM